MNSPISSFPSYHRPSWIMLRIFDPLTRLLVGKFGMDDRNGTRVLEVQGRASGLWRATPVKLLELDGQRYLVAMYGTTDWSKNLRARGFGRIRFGRQVFAFRAHELADDQKIPILRAYLKRWWSLVAQMTPITSPNAPDAQIAGAAYLHPVFSLEEIPGERPHA
jgi:deazaflavin-dependent oxidoreductase (nitroreductase family)